MGFAMPVLAQQQGKSPRYGSWNAGPSASPGPGQIAQMVKELKTLIDAAERVRAADPLFLRDLKRLARRYGNAWPVRLIEEDFSDRDFTNNPTWVVSTGYFDVSWRGLISRVNERRARQDQPQPQTRQGNEDVAAALLGQLLNQALGGSSSQQQQQAQQQEQQRRRAPRRAKIYLDQKITNSFSMTAVVTGRGDTGGVSLAVYQGLDKRRNGYRLAFMPGEGFMLARVSRRGASIIDRSDISVDINDGNEHMIVWERRSKGRMVVKLDGKPLFSTADRGFNDPFDGFALVNRGGEYILNKLIIDGTR